ncbi:MAG: hypothetical protein ACUZ8I_07690 [Candidatus Scalindua sp.]
MPTGEYPANLLDIGDVKECISQMTEFKQWLVMLFPESFPKGGDADFSLVIQKAKGLIMQYVNLKKLLEG